MLEPPPRPRLVVLVALLVAGSFGWFVFFALFRESFGQDWMVFDTAARAYWHGDASLMNDGVRMTRVLNATHPTLGQPLVFHPWVYPPFTLLLALPFGLVPWALSYGGFQALSFAGMAVGLRPFAVSPANYWLVLAGVILCPATAYTLGAGQNSFLSASLLLGGVALLGARPVAAGILFGLLAYKPQLGLLIPVALVSAGAGRAFAAAAATVVSLILCSLMVPGLAVWRGFIDLYLAGQQTPRLWVELYGQSVFTYLRLAGVSVPLANGGQALALLIGAAAVWVAFRPPARPRHRLLVLLCAVSFSSPHFGDYDAVLLGITSMLLIARPPEPPGIPLIVLACLAWCSTAINPPYLFARAMPPIFPVAEMTPLVILALLACLVAPPGRRAALLVSAE